MKYKVRNLERSKLEKKKFEYSISYIRLRLLKYFNSGNQEI